MLSADTTAAVSSYSGGVKTFAISKNYLVLHEHGLSDGQGENYQEYSSLTLLRRVDNTFEIIKKISSPEFVAIKWSQNSQFLVAISNLFDSESNHIYVFDQELNDLIAMPWGCSPQHHNPLFCNNTKVEQRWLNKMLDRVSVKIIESGVEICTDKFCREVIIPHRQ